MHAIAQKIEYAILSLWSIATLYGLSAAVFLPNLAALVEKPT